MIYYKDKNVFDEALDRIRMIFDYHDDVIVSMSGGKDSTVMFNLALMVAREKNRLPLKVFWLDQEAEWQGTVDYMSKIMHMPEVKPYWFQVPFDFPNNLSQKNKTLKVWDDAAKDKWIHPLSDVGIHELPEGICGDNRDKAFYVLTEELHEVITDSDNCACLVGLRMSESLIRRTTIMHSPGKWHGITWCTSKKKGKKHRTFWPIYDFSDDDIWTAIAKNHWEYNVIYDKMYQWGVAKRKMRVSALIHETAWWSIQQLQEFEPQTYNRFVARLSGVSTFNHAFDEGGVLPHKLPFAFSSWKEYRDYLLENIIPAEDRQTYINRWKNQDSEIWYPVHVEELILNDTCGTLNNNHQINVSLKKKSGENGILEKRFRNEYNQYTGGTNGN